MVAPFIAVSNVVTPQMRRYAGASAAAVGNSFGAVDTGFGAGGGSVPSGRVIRFGGLNTYLAAVSTNIYRSTDGGSTWTVVLALPSADSSNSARKSGFSVIYLNGLPAVALIYARTAATNTWGGAYSFDGVTWTTQGPFTGVSLTSTGGTFGSGSYVSQIVSGSTLYCGFIHPGTSMSAIIWSPGSNSGSAFSLPGGTSGTDPAVVEFNNRIFVCGAGSGGVGQDFRLWELVGNAGTLISTPVSTTAGFLTGSATGAFVDGAFMYIMGRSSSTGLQIFQYDSALSPTTITSTVFPAALITCNGQAKIISMIDGVSSPGSAPTIYLWFTNNTSGSGGGPWALYQWNGPATQISLIDQGGSSADCIPFFKNTTGTYFIADSVFPSTTGISVEITNRIFTATGVRLSFKLYGTSAGGAVSFRIYVGGTDAEYPTTAGTLIDPSVGAISGGNINTGLTADNGVTTYLVTWAAQTDGFATNSEFRLVGDAFV